MKSLLIALLIMAPLYLLLCQEQGKQLDAISGSSGDGGAKEHSVPDNAAAQVLRTYQQPLDKAKGVEAMLNQGVQDRMRNIDED
ncbi:MAG: hypothetical protein JKX92_09135 [Porticoccaceae bacterium]|nr:hypothetical protein [Porticoccaceae bacterium]